MEARSTRHPFLRCPLQTMRIGNAALPPSCPDLFRASIWAGRRAGTWMAGTSPAMTGRGRFSHSSPLPDLRFMRRHCNAALPRSPSSGWCVPRSARAEQLELVDADHRPRGSPDETMQLGCHASNRRTAPRSSVDQLRRRFRDRAGLGPEELGTSRIGLVSTDLAALLGFRTKRRGLESVMQSTILNRTPVGTSPAIGKGTIQREHHGLDGAPDPGSIFRAARLPCSSGQLLGTAQRIRP